MEDHVHCSVCYHPLPTTKLVDGEVQAIPVKSVNQQRVVMAPQGLVSIAMQRPCCDKCFQDVVDQERLQASRSKIVVAPAGAVPMKAQ